MATNGSGRVLSRRITRLAIGLTAVVGLAGTMVACGGGADDASVTVDAFDPSATPADALAHAADASAAVQSGSYSITMTIAGDARGTSFDSTVNGSGSFTAGGRLSQTSMDMSAYMADIARAAGAPASAVPERFAVDMVMDGTTMYMRFDTVPTEPMLEGWFRTDLTEQAKNFGMDTNSMTSGGISGGSFTSFVESMRGAGNDVTEVGTESLDGVEVTRYEGTIDPQAAIDRADPEKRAELRGLFRQSGMGQPMPFVAWIDGDGILRRMEQTVTMDGGTGLSLDAKYVMEVTELGQPVTITVPSDGEVRDYSQLLSLSQPNA